MRYTQTALERFNEKYIIDDISGCWNWTGASRNKATYGCMFLNGKVVDAHRISYIFFKGETQGLLVCHTCDNKKCVNPNHLYLGTHKDNLDDFINKYGSHPTKMDMERYQKRVNSQIKHPSVKQYNKGCRCDGCKFLKSQMYYRTKNKKL